ncbi:hypothetical protein KC19_VG300400 [Ceratodon purpureus]|uniref:AMP deaminase n=1 Tax=Ceratodon purpureus TaxID=3225 RepID=A0A8T0HUZ8_CERPU|nr:hypothetical protein KC19_VG300400 [Ceratodon purpureus]
MMENSCAKTWVSVVIGAIVGAGFATASAYLLHMRILEQMQTRLELEELNRRRQGKLAKRIARLHDCDCEDAAPISNAQGETIATAVGCHAHDSSKPSFPSNMDNEDSSIAINDMSTRLPRVETQRDGIGTQPSSSSPAPWQCHASPILRHVPVIRPTTSKSPVFADMEGSDEEDHVLQNEDEQNYIMDEVMGLTGVDGDDIAGCTEHVDADEIVGDGMVRLACGNNLLHSEPTMLRQRLKEDEPSTRVWSPTTDVNVDPRSSTDKSLSNKLRSHTIPGDIHSMHKPDPIAADILRKEPEQEQFVRLIVSPNELPSMEEEEHIYKMVDGVMRVYASDKETIELFPVNDATTFFTDMHRILRIIALGNVRTLCHRRLKLLEQKFSLHLMLNADREFLAQKSAPHRDFYNVRKVDTHVHHTSCMNQKHLLRFIKSKLRRDSDGEREKDVVIFRDGKYLTLKEVFESLDLTGYDLNVDLLDVHVDKNTFHRFDKFNLKYNPCGQSRLREIFLKQDNLIQGRYLAELTKQVFLDIENSKYQMAEYRISIYGRKESEWDQLASWIVTNKLRSDNVTWLIQPLFEVTVDPASHPQLHVFLKFVVGFDMVDDESKPERRPTKHMQTPAEWNNPFNPAYSYWAYYVYANLYVLNKLRESKGMSTIKFRPHSGEAGDLDHLAATFMVAHNIAHGNNLRKSPGLQYLYYLAQTTLCKYTLQRSLLLKSMALLLRCGS